MALAEDRGGDREELVDNATWPVRFRRRRGGGRPGPESGRWASGVVGSSGAGPAVGRVPVLPGVGVVGGMGVVAGGVAVTGATLLGLGWGAPPHGASPIRWTDQGPAVGVTGLAVQTF